MATSSPPVPTSDNDSASASASPANSNSASIALKIRTLDQKTYPIVVRTDASVPQLKEVVATETGVVLARQRLIFRGKVLKNDQSIAAYALDDGHVLHLVVRAEEVVAANGEAEQEHQRQSQPPQQSSTTAARARSATAPRNNDEPDPTVGLSPGRPRMVMGATIAVPDDMPMPFLNSVIANFVNSMGTAAAGAAGAGAAPGDDAQRTQRNRDMLRRLRRARSAADNATGAAGTTASAGSRRRGREAGEGGAAVTGESMSFASTLSGNMLRDSAESQLRRLEMSVSNSAFDLPDVQPREDAAGATAEGTPNDEVVQAHLEQLRGHIERFGPRMDRLPAALREIGWYASQNQEAPHGIVSSTVRAIDTLQNVGDSASTIARFARHVFLANSPDIPAPMVRIDDRGTLRASLSFPIMGGTGGALPPGALPRTRAERQQTRGLASITRAMPNSDGNGNNGSSNNGSATPAAPESPGVLRSLYQRVASGFLGSRGSEGSADAGAASPMTNPGSPAVLHPDDEGDVGINQFTISALSGPFPPVFPMSFSGGALFPPPERTNRPEWDVAGLWQRLVRDLRAATVFGILRGDPVAVYDVMRSLATIFVAGAYTPALTSTPIRVWARRLLIAVRRELGEQTVPTQILDLTPDRNASRLVEELTRPFDPFMPELVDHIRRSNAASQGDLFGRSCTEFLRNMAIQFLTRVRAYVNDDEAQATRLMEGILVALDVDEGLASYVVTKLVEFSSPSPRPRRPRDVDAGDAPSVKRARRE